MHLALSQPEHKQINSNKDKLLIKIKAAIPSLSGTSPPLSAYAENFVSLSSKINFACVCEFVKFNFQLSEQESCFTFQ